MSAEFILLVIASAGAGVSASFAILCFLRTQQLPAALTAQGAQILRAETDIVRAVIEEQARGLRQELGHSLKGLQRLPSLLLARCETASMLRFAASGSDLMVELEALTKGRRRSQSSSMPKWLKWIRSECQPRDPENPDRAEAQLQHRSASRSLEDPA